MGIVGLLVFLVGVMVLWLHIIAAISHFTILLNNISVSYMGRVISEENTSKNQKG